MGPAEEDIAAARACLDFVRRRMARAAFAEAVTAPAACWLLAAAALVALSRALDGPPPPPRPLALAALVAAVVALARFVTLRPTVAAAALRLDRLMDGKGRWLALADRDVDPAVAAWAARGALDGTSPDHLDAAVTHPAPRALPAVLLSGTLLAGLLLLAPPVAPSVAAPPAGEGVETASGGTGGGAGEGAPGAPSGPTGPPTAPAPDPGNPAPEAGTPSGGTDLAASLEALRERARRDGDAAALAALDRAAAALAGGDEAGALAAAREAADALSGGSTAASGTGAGGSGGASTGPGAGPGEGEAFTPFPVPVRAREAVRRYFAETPVPEESKSR